MFNFFDVRNHSESSPSSSFVSTIGISGRGATGIYPNYEAMLGRVAGSTTRFRHNLFTVQRVQQGQVSISWRLTYTASWCHVPLRSCRLLQSSQTNWSCTLLSFLLERQVKFTLSLLLSSNILNDHVMWISGIRCWYSCTSVHCDRKGKGNDQFASALDESMADRYGWMDGIDLNQ